MSVRVDFLNQHSCYTNFDYVEGRVVLCLVQPETIAAITVKLEGESRTRLAGVLQVRGQYDGFQRDQTQLEVHKVCKSAEDGKLPRHALTRDSCSISSKWFFLRQTLPKPRRDSNTRCPRDNMNILFGSGSVIPPDETSEG